MAKTTNGARIPILHENSEWIAVDKPAGLSVHNTEDPENLLNVLTRQLGAAQLLPAHRLDKETSGIQLLARHPTAAKKLADEFQLRSVKKLYIGVLRGQLMLNAGTWAHPLTDKSEGRRNPAGIAKDRVPCETRFQIIKSSPHFTLCEFDLITGRQHQIRKHAALARHALVGDPRYGDRDYNEKISERYSESRLCLHCLKITILGQVIESATPVSFEKMF